MGLFILQPLSRSSRSSCVCYGCYPLLFFQPHWLTCISFCFMQVSFRKDAYLLPVHLIDFSWRAYHWLQKGPFSRFPDGYNPIAHWRVWILQILLGNSSAWETFAHLMTSDWILRNTVYHKTVPLNALNALMLKFAIIFWQ